jgi:2'-5' RNA ligase
VARPLESALVLVLGDASAFDAIRREFAQGAVARGIPFHITLLYPFAPVDELTDSLLEDARAFFAERRPFEFALTRVAAWPRVVYAVPEPDGELRGCMRALHARFPDWPPYGGLHADVVPHATLGEDIDAARVVPEVKRRLAAHLPRRYIAEAATLLQERAPDEWRTRERFRFGG